MTIAVDLGRKATKQTKTKRLIHWGKTYMTKLHCIVKVTWYLGQPQHPVDMTQHFYQNVLQFMHSLLQCIIPGERAFSLESIKQINVPIQW